MPRHLIVAIDGPAGAGKSTIARRLAERLGCLYIDTGAMYRAVALAALRAQADFQNGAALGRLADGLRIELNQDGGISLNGEDVRSAIREPHISEFASKVSAEPEVRQALVPQQQAFGARQAVVMEGRDIGSVVFPEATVKIYLDADPAVRAVRRVEELRAKGQSADLKETEEAIRVRDKRDRERKMSPLTVAPGALVLDTSGLTLDQVEQRILEIVRQRTATEGEPIR